MRRNYKNALINTIKNGDIVANGISFLNRISNKKAKMMCFCGVEFINDFYKVKDGVRVSCGCETKHHGMTGTSIYNIWIGMKDRCYNVNNGKYKRYGDRGIKVCERWRSSFDNFYHDMGDRPSNLHSIDRKDNDGDYTPENCRWATNIEQCQNKSNTKYIEFNGIYLTISEWEFKLGFKKGVLRNRLDKKWSVDRAFTQKFTERGTI